MDTILIVYLSRTGQTEKVAFLIAEGIRSAGKLVEIKRLDEIDNAKDLQSYAGLVLGCPTYFKSITGGMKRFLFMSSQVNLEGKVGGAFGSYIYSGESGSIIYDTMQFVLKMKMVPSGALNIQIDTLESEESMDACRDYGRNVAELLEGNTTTP